MCHVVQIQIEILGSTAETILVPYNYYDVSRPVFQFRYNGDVYVVTFDGNTNTWLLYDPQGSPAYELPNNSDCPVSTTLDWFAISGTVALRQFDITKATLPYECGIDFRIDYKGDLVEGHAQVYRSRNGLPTYIFWWPNGAIEISYAGAGLWVLTPADTYSLVYYTLNASVPVGSWTPTSAAQGISKRFGTTVHPCPIVGKCDCGIQFNLQYKDQGVIWTFEPVGELNGQYVFQFNADGQILSVWFDGGGTWLMTIGDILNDENNGTITGQKQNAEICCPYNQDNQHDNYVWDSYFEYRGTEYQVISVLGIACICRNEDRIWKEYSSIKLPQAFTEENRGVEDCCCRELVLAGGSNAFMNDITSAWIKLSSPSDSCKISVWKEGNVLANWQPQVHEFVNEPNAFYATVEWKSVIGDDGVGCYQIKIEYDIAGIQGSYVWGNYDLRWYSIQSALGTARLRAVFDGYHEIEGIDFSGSAVPSTLRFYGFIGFRQPNFEIDNVIYGDRQMKRNLRENLNSYEIITEPVDECITKPMIELYLLSENELFISDYNAHNHSYRYQDLPVIVEDSPAIDYIDPFSRKAVVKCKVGDKYKNKRTYY